MTTKYSQNGQYNLKKVELILPDGNRIDLKNVFLDISIYESLMSTTMSGNISIVDSSNQFNSEFLGNGEVIYLDFETAGSKNNIVYYGTVYKCSPPNRVSEHSSGIILYFTSSELINNNRMIVEDAFNDQSSNVVNTLFNRVKNKKNIDIVKSKNINKFVSASHTPFEIISDLAARSISSANDHGYLFYENNREFNFKPIQYLYQQKSSNSYYYKTAGVFKDSKKREEEAFNSIQDYEIVAMPNLIEQIDDGVLGSTSVNLNLLDKAIVENRYDNQSAFDRNKSLGKLPNLKTNMINNQYSDIKEVRTWLRNDPFHKARFVNIKELLNAQRYGAKISVFGDTANVVGAIVECSLPVWGSEANKNANVPDPFSGRCLIIAIKHTIQKTKYTQTLKLVKDSFEAGK